MVKKQVCAYSTCDDKYAPMAAVSLLSIRNWQPEIPLFIIGRYFSDKTKLFLKKYDITVIEKNYDNIFHTAWNGYPLECYYMFVGPEILYEKGYSYSFYIDGDIYCNNDPLSFDITDIKDFAGVHSRGTIREILEYGAPGDSEIALKVFGNKKTLDERRIQTGTMYFNNKSLAKKGFIDKIGSVYQQAIDNDIPRKGDDSLLALFRLAYPSWQYLAIPRIYNVVTYSSGEGSKRLRLHIDMIDKAIFYHFNKNKPWENCTLFPTYAYEYFYHKWRRHSVDVLETTDLVSYFPNIASKLTQAHVKFTWKPDSANFSDALMQYFLHKCCGIEDAAQYRLTEHEKKSLHSQQNNTTFYLRIKQLLMKKVVTLRKNTTNPVIKYIAVGSKLNQNPANHGLIYGGGISNFEQPVGQHVIRFIRGQISRHQILLAGNGCPPLYGEPAHVLPKFYSPILPQKFKIGIVLNTRNEWLLVKKKYAADPEVNIINIQSGDIESIINQLLSCKSVLSNSLDGIALCHAYEIPVRQIIYSRLLYKEIEFADYYSSLDGIHIEPVQAFNYSYLPLNSLLSLTFEVAPLLPTRRIQEQLFFDEKGIRKSIYYPY